MADIRGQVTVTGLNRLVRSLSSAGADAQDMKDLMHRIGMIVVNAANPPVKSGALAGSLRAGRGKTKAVARAGGARVPYAGVINYGWPLRGISGRHYLDDALQRKQGEALQELNRGIGEILRRNNLI